MSDKKIKKVKIKDDQLIVTYSTKDAKGEPVTVENEKHSAPFHDDLLTAFGNLRIHLAVMTGFVSPSQVKQIQTPKEELYEDFTITGFSMGSDDDDPGVTVTGGRNLPNMNNK